MLAGANLGKLKVVSLTFKWLWSKIGIAGPNLDILYIQQLDLPSCEKYAKLYFGAKHLEKGLNKVGEIFGALFFKKVLVLANIGCCPNFLDYALCGHLFSS